MNTVDKPSRYQTSGFPEIPGMLKKFAMIAAFLLAATPLMANTLKDISYSSLGGDEVQIVLSMTGSAEEPMIFIIDNPARIALDLPDTMNGLDKRSDSVGLGAVNGYSSAEARGKTRVVLDLSAMTTYRTVVKGNDIVLTLGGAEADIVDTAASPVSPASDSARGYDSIRSIDFKRGPGGEGLINVTLPSPRTVVDIRQEGGKLVADFMKTSLPAELQRILDVQDFATPVFTISTTQKSGLVRMEVTVDAQNEYLAYQSNEDFIIEVKPLSVEQVAEKEKDQYTGEKLSLNFQDIEVRSVLQLLADFTGLNVVVSDTVGGNLTLRLKNVPWDQALDIILRTKGLAKRQTGNVMLIAPTAEIANAERLELEAAQQIQELEPLITEFIQVNYADAGEISTIIQTEGNSLISERGSVTVDARTNTLLVNDTPSRISQIRKLITELDIPVRQVMIESRIVVANDDFSKSLGVRFGYSRQEVIGGSGGEYPFRTGQQRTSYRFGGTQAGTLVAPDAAEGEDALPTGSGFVIGGNEALMVDLPSTLTGSSVQLAVGRIGSYLLQLELSAMQKESRGEIISSPRLITADNNAASIKQGVEIPYQEASSSGAATTSFKKATLGLDVTPQITPDNIVIMDLTVSKDAPGTVYSGIPSIDTQSITTQVVVDNGETIVLGGVYERNVNDSFDRVPFFGDLPYVGWAFRRESSTNRKTELLIFVTPKILKESAQIN